MNFNVSKEEILEGMHTMNSFGTRLTGGKGHTDFIKWLKSEIADKRQGTVPCPPCNWA